MGHVVEVAHHADARVVELLAEGGRLFEAIDVERLGFGERLQQRAAADLQSIIAQFRQEVLRHDLVQFLGS